MRGAVCRIQEGTGAQAAGGRYEKKFERGPQGDPLALGGRANERRAKGIPQISVIFGMEEGELKGPWDGRRDERVEKEYIEGDPILVMQRRKQRWATQDPQQQSRGKTPRVSAVGLPH